ncbi:MAG: GFA family protein, partial [Gemmatimonadales bacterium]
ERRIQGWIVKPPGFAPAKQYPLILEIHGGPFANYGDRFSTEAQLYAAAGFRLTKGEEVLVDYQSSEHVTRHFCGRCGSPLFCNDARHANEVHLTLAHLKGETGLKPEAHFFFDSRATWSNIEDDLPKLGGEGGITPL